MKIVTTEDGSHSLYSEQFNEHYHSTYGAVQESMHVFIEAGLNKCSLQEVNILEAGFGTGLNAFLALQNSIEKGRKVYYYSIELYPLKEEVYRELNYAAAVDFDGAAKYFQALHEAEWDTDVQISPDFTLRKVKGSLTEAALPQDFFDVVFYDAFAPDTQPELWTEEIFAKVYSSMKREAILTTYCVKGIVKRAMRAAGLKVEKLQGPPGKREMIRAVKGSDKGGPGD